MEEKYLKLLDRQIEKLSAGDFDLEAWKSSAVYLIRMIFGPGDLKIKEIENLRVEYSSWSLRDSSPDHKPIETCKKKGREILTIAKDEIELLGVTNKKKEVHELLKTMVSDSQYEKLMEPTATAKDKTAVLKSLTKSQLIELLRQTLT